MAALCMRHVCKLSTLLRSPAFAGFQFRHNSLSPKRTQAFQSILPVVNRFQPVSTLPTAPQCDNLVSKNVLQSVNREINANLSRLFAIVYISGKQFKVTTNDLIQTHSHIDADVGDRIRLQKVLMVGGENFTILGKPLVSLDVVKVEATVIEKTMGPVIVVFRFFRRKRHKKYQEKKVSHTVLRINSIEVASVSP